MAKVVVMDHPLIQHKIGIMRRKETGSKEFRTLVSEVAMLECYEATRDLELTDVEIETPICKTTVKGKETGSRTNPACRSWYGGRNA
jgi:uracil phosphoribosyltransferase